MTSGLFSTGYGADQRAVPAFVATWIRTTWPFIALALGVVFVVVGGILFTP